MQRRFPWSLVLVIMFIQGCGQPVSEIRSVVLLDGEPLSGVAVQFWPKNDLSRPCGAAGSDELGQYNLVSHPRGSRWQTGMFVVRVIDPTVDVRDWFSDRVQPRFPWCYWDETTSPLEVEIHRGANSPPPLELYSNVSVDRN